MSCRGSLSRSSCTIWLTGCCSCPISSASETGTVTLVSLAVTARTAERTGPVAAAIERARPRAAPGSPRSLAGRKVSSRTNGSLKGSEVCGARNTPGTEVEADRNLGPAAVRRCRFNDRPVSCPRATRACTTRRNHALGGEAAAPATALPVADVRLGGRTGLRHRDASPDAGRHPGVGVDVPAGGRHPQDAGASVLPVLPPPGEVAEPV